MEYPTAYWETEVRNGFLVPTIMKKAWATQIKILEQIDKICESNNIKYWVDWGTLLGAVRHKGFIPWDDDMDISMPRDDYNRFKKLMQDKKSDLEIVEVPSEEAFGSYVTRVVNNTKISFENDKLDEYYGFPYVAGVDIFPIDNVPDSKSERDILLKKINIIYSVIVAIYSKKIIGPDKEELLKEIEKGFKIVFNKDEDIIRQLWDLMHKVFSTYNNKKTKEVALMTEWASDTKRYIYKAYYFDEIIKLQFENTTVKVPKYYDEVLKADYGNYNIIKIDAEGHDYPFFEKQHNFLEWDNIDFTYEKCFFKKDYIKRKVYNNISYKQNIDELFVLLERINEKIVYMLKEEIYDNQILDLIENSQNLAIRIGNIIEHYLSDDEQVGIVSLLETYSEKLYLLYCLLTGQNEGDLIELILSMNELLNVMEEIIYRFPEVSQVKNVLLVFSKIKEWEALSDVYNKLKDFDGIKITVMCIPYMLRNFKGEYGEYVSEADEFIEEIELTDYENFDFNNNRFDAIIVCDGYENGNLAGSVPTFFYPSSLQEYTPRVIYISPYDIDDNFTSINQKAGKNMFYYVTMPGIASSDRIVVKSNKLKEMYNKVLTAWSGNETKDIWEGKVVSMENSDIVDIIFE